jgi:hypothetical protein
LPAWARKTPKVTEVLPLLYLHSRSTGDFVPALGQFLGSGAGLSGPVITRLTETWQAEQRAFAARDLRRRRRRSATRHAAHRGRGLTNISPRALTTVRGRR